MAGYYAARKQERENTRFLRFNPDTEGTACVIYKNNLPSARANKLLQHTKP